MKASDLIPILRHGTDESADEYVAMDKAATMLERFIALADEMDKHGPMSPNSSQYWAKQIRRIAGQGEKT